jgi:hypothetical protein
MNSVKNSKTKCVATFWKKTHCATTNSAGNSRKQHSAWHITKSLNSMGTMHPCPRNWWRTANSIKNATCPPICGYSDWQTWRLWRTSQPWAASTVSSVRDMFVLQSHGKMKQQRVAVIAEKLCLHCEMILLKNWNSCLKTCPFWSRSDPPAASWQWHSWMHLLQKMSRLTSNWQTLENSSTSSPSIHYKRCYTSVIVGL